LTVADSAFTGNMNDQGGGIFNFGKLTLRRSTLNGNKALDFAGQRRGDRQLRRGPDYHNVHAEPLLGPLADNGGQIETRASARPARRSTRSRRGDPSAQTPSTSAA
jgi:hypothetical protein